MALSPHQALAREVFRELIEIDTTHATGDTTRAANALAARLREAGIPGADLRVLAPHPRKGNLVARLRGTGRRRPLLLLAHLDVVEADPAEWETDPFTFVERDGHFYGRGSTDDKAMAAMWVANLIRLRREGLAPDRDIVLALTADEEGGEHNGARWLLDQHRGLVDAEYGLNEGGYGRLRGGRRISLQVQASEKVYLDVELLARGRGGHSSLPSDDNALLHLAAALGRLAAHRFPVRLGEVTRAFFERVAEIETDRTADDMRAILRTPPDAAAAERLSAIPHYHGLLRATCVPTRLEAGHSNNVIPPVARAVLNCRLLPDQGADEVLRSLTEAVADERVLVRPLSAPMPSPPSPLLAEILEPIERIAAHMWPGVPVVPVMGIGATDSRHFRAAGIPMYGVSGIFLDVDDVRAHAPDERIPVDSFFDGLEFLYRLIRELGGGG